MGPRRFERPTSSLSGTRSNQLSYEPYRPTGFPAVDRKGIVKGLAFLSTYTSGKLMIQGVTQDGFSCHLTFPPTMVVTARPLTRQPLNGQLRLLPAK